MNKQLNVIVLAGGKGTRLRSVISDKPKVLANVAGRPFIEYLLNQINTLNNQLTINKVIIATGYMADQVVDTLGYQYKKLDIIYSKEDKPLGTAGALGNYIHKLESYNQEESYLVLNGDSYINIDIYNYYKWYLDSKIEAAILLNSFNKIIDSVANLNRYGSVQFDGSSNKILKFSEKKDFVLKDNNIYMNAGIYLFNAKILKNIPIEQYCSLENELLPKLITNNILYGYRTASQFIDIGLPETYSLANNIMDSIDIKKEEEYDY